MVRKCKHGRGFCLGFALGVFAPGANFNQVLALEGVIRLRLQVAQENIKFCFEFTLGFAKLKSAFSALTEGENFFAPATCRKSLRK